MAFDFGLRRIGIAIGQEITKTASPLEIFPAHDGQPDWSRLLKLIREWQPRALIVGLPLTRSGESYGIHHQAKAFAKKLEQHSALPVYLINEDLTTKSARSIVAESETMRRSQKKRVDTISACLILEEWLKSSF